MDSDQLQLQLAKHGNNEVRVRILGLHAPIIGVTHFQPSGETVIHIDPEWLPGGDDILQRAFAATEPGE